MLQIKIGFQKPSIKKSISARIIGRTKGAVKKAIISGYKKEVWDGLQILIKPPITRYIGKPHLVD